MAQSEKPEEGELVSRRKTLKTIAVAGTAGTGVVALSGKTLAQSSSCESLEMPRTGGEVSIDICLIEQNGSPAISVALTGPFNVELASETIQISEGRTVVTLDTSQGALSQVFQFTGGIISSLPWNRFKLRLTIDHREVSSTSVEVEFQGCEESFWGGSDCTPWLTAGDVSL